MVGDGILDIVDVDAQHLGKRRCGRAAGQDDGELRGSARVRRRKISWGAAWVTLSVQGRSAKHSFW